jgi:hypothetical protein
MHPRVRGAGRWPTGFERSPITSGADLAASHVTPEISPSLTVVLYSCRSAIYEGFEHSLITSLDVAEHNVSLVRGGARMHLLTTIGYTVNTRICGGIHPFERCFEQTAGVIQECSFR